MIVQFRMTQTSAQSINFRILSNVPLKILVFLVHNHNLILFIDLSPGKIY